MVIQYKSLNKIKFPVYVLPSGNWDRQDGLLFLDGKIVDDRNMSGDTLGVRRLQTPHKNVFPLKHNVQRLTLLGVSMLCLIRKFREGKKKEAWREDRTTHKIKVY